MLIFLPFVLYPLLLFEFGIADTKSTNVDSMQTSKAMQYIEIAESVQDRKMAAIMAKKFRQSVNKKIKQEVKNWYIHSEEGKKVRQEMKERVKRFIENSAGE